MFARTLSVLINGVALATAATIALVVGSACKGPVDYCETVVAFHGAGAWNCNVTTFAAVARGAKVIPTPTPADTLARASATFNSTTLAYTYTVQVAPTGTIDSIALYDTSATGTLPASATAILCAGAAACASTSGTGMLVAPATRATIETLMRAYGTQLVFFTTTAQKAAGGAMRGTIYPTP
jgi:hypothetical protein